MCLRCEGFTEEQVEEIYDLTISVQGYLLLSVDDEDGPEWSYTVGLTENFDHPDLVCIDIKIEGQRQLLRSISEIVMQAGSVAADELERLDVELVPVHPSHLCGDFVAMWVNRYDRMPRQGEFVQVFPGPSWFCSCHAGRYRQRLDTPDVA